MTASLKFSVEKMGSDAANREEGDINMTIPLLKFL